VIKKKKKKKRAGAMGGIFSRLQHPF